MVARRGIAVYTGSADTVHKFLDDGSSAIGNDADSICTVTGQLSASQGLSGTYIYGDGSKLTNVVASEIEAAGATGDIQFNLDDDLAADTGVFTYVNATDTLGVLADGGSFALGGDSDVTLTHDGGTGATLASVGAFVVDGADAVTVDSDAALTLGGASLDVDADGGAIDIDATAAVSIDSSAGSVTMGAILADGQTLTLGKTNATAMVFTPHGTAASEKISLTNTAGDAADAIKLTSTAGGVDIDAGTALALDGASGINIGTAADVAVDVDSSTFDLDASAAITLTAGAAMDLDSADAISLNSSAGAINVGNDAVAQNINVGTGAAARTLTFGNVTGATAVAVNAGTGGVALASTGTGDITLDSDDTLLLDADGVLELNSSAGAINIGNDDVDQNINIGTQGERTMNLSTGAFASTVNIGNETGATALDLDAGTGGVAIDAQGAGAINVGTETDTGAINVGTGASARTITVGNTTGATGLALKAGSGKVVVTGDMTVSGDSTLGDASADVATVNGRLQIGKFDPATHADAVLLETMATTPATYNGSMIYLSVTAASGTYSAAYFANPDKWYFCESGSWYPSPFSSD